MKFSANLWHGGYIQEVERDFRRRSEDCEGDIVGGHDGLLRWERRREKVTSLPVGILRRQLLRCPSWSEYI